MQEDPLSAPTVCIVCLEIVASLGGDHRGDDLQILCDFCIPPVSLGIRDEDCAWDVFVQLCIVVSCSRLCQMFVLEAGIQMDLQTEACDCCNGAVTSGTRVLGWHVCMHTLLHRDESGG